MDERFDGWIAGLGTAAGLRVVAGIWPRSPLGAFADVMVERPDGHRLLLAPSPEVADFVAGTYLFDEVRVGPVHARTDGVRWRVDAAPLALGFTVGRRAPLGVLLRAVPGGWPPHRAGSPRSTWSPGTSCPGCAPGEAPVAAARSSTARWTCTT